MTTADGIESERGAHGKKLVGRSRELDAIARALPEVEQGRGKLVVLSGEPGIGKTSLADATTRLAEQRGFVVHWGRCWESGGAPAYFPWLGVLSSMAGVLDDQALVHALGDGAPVLADLLPELRQRLPPVSSGAPPPPDEARFRVFRAIVALTRERARLEKSGLVIVLDDLHAADRSSLLLLHFLSRELRGLKLLLLATYRDVEARMDTETSELVARIGREGTCYALARLKSEDAAHLVGAHAGPVGGRVSERILERAQGNPLFLEEMLRLLAEQGPESIDAGVVPHGVRDVIGQRLGRVSANWSTWLNGIQTDETRFRSELQKLVANAKQAASSKRTPIAITVTDGASALAEINGLFGFTPDFLAKFPETARAGAWRQMRDVQLSPKTALSGKSKELIGLAVASQVPCRYCIVAHTEFAKLNGATENEIREAIAMASLTRSMSTLLNGLMVDEGQFRRDVDRVVRGAKAAAAKRAAANRD